MSHGDVWDKSLPGSTCKGPEMRALLMCFRISRMTVCLGQSKWGGSDRKMDTKMVASGEEKQIMRVFKAFARTLAFTLSEMGS